MAATIASAVDPLAPGDVAAHLLCDGIQSGGEDRPPPFLLAERRRHVSGRRDTGACPSTANAWQRSRHDIATAISSASWSISASTPARTAPSAIRWFSISITFPAPRSDSTSVAPSPGQRDLGSRSFMRSRSATWCAPTVIAAERLLGPASGSTVSAPANRSRSRPTNRDRGTRSSTVADPRGATIARVNRAESDADSTRLRGGPSRPNGPLGGIRTPGHAGRNRVLFR